MLAFPAIALASDPLQVALTGKDGTIVRDIWSTLLNFANILAVIGFLFVAFSNIFRFQINAYAVKKVLPSLIIAIIAANLSFLACRVLIDVSAVVTANFIDGAKSLKTNFGQVGLEEFSAKINNKPVSNPDPATNSTNSIDQGGTQDTTFGDGAALLLGSIIKVIGALFVFVLGAMFMLRIYVLYFLISISPLAFISLGLPFAKSIWSKWWKNYWQWVFMTPVATFWLWLGAKFWEITNTFNAFSKADDFAGIQVAPYFFGIFCIYMAMTTPFKMAGEFSSVAGKLQNMAMTATGVYAGQRLAQNAANVGKEYGEIAALKATPIGMIKRATKQGAEARAAVKAGAESGPVGHSKLGEFIATATGQRWLEKNRMRSTRESRAYKEKMEGKAGLIEEDALDNEKSRKKLAEAEKVKEQLATIQSTSKQQIEQLVEEDKAHQDLMKSLKEREQKLKEILDVEKKIKEAEVGHGVMADAAHQDELQLLKVKEAKLKETLGLTQEIKDIETEHEKLKDEIYQNELRRLRTGKEEATATKEQKKADEEMKFISGEYSVEANRIQGLVKDKSYDNFKTYINSGGIVGSAEENTLKESIAQDIYGKSFAALSVSDQGKVQDKVDKMKEDWDFSKDKSQLFNNGVSVTSFAEVESLMDEYSKTGEGGRAERVQEALVDQGLATAMIEKRQDDTKANFAMKELQDMHQRQRLFELNKKLTSAGVNIDNVLSGTFTGGATDAEERELHEVSQQLKKKEFVLNNAADVQARADEYKNEIQENPDYNDIKQNRLHFSVVQPYLAKKAEGDAQSETAVDTAGAFLKNTQDNRSKYYQGLHQEMEESTLMDMHRKAMTMSRSFQSHAESPELINAFRGLNDILLQDEGPIRAALQNNSRIDAAGNLGRKDASGTFMATGTVNVGTHSVDNFDDLKKVIELGANQKLQRTERTQLKTLISESGLLDTVGWGKKPIFLRPEKSIGIQSALKD